MSAGEVLAFARGGVVSVSLLEGAKAEAVEVIVQEGAPVIGQRLMDLSLPKECLICAYVRGGEAYIPNGQSVLLEGDRIILSVRPNIRKRSCSTLKAGSSMDRHILFYLVGRLILVNGLSLIIPLTAGLLWGERGLLYFGPSLMAAVALSAFCLYRGRHHKRQVGAGEGAWYMVLVWLILSLLGMVPYVMAGVFTSPADAFLKVYRPLRRRERRSWQTAAPPFRHRSSYGTASWAGWGA